MAKQNKITINVAKILAPVVGSRDLMPVLADAINRTNTKLVDLDFSEVEFISRSAAHALLLMKEDLQRKWLNKKYITFVNTSNNVQEILRVVAANRAVPKNNKANILFEKTDINSLAKCSC